jgi:signal transduction histidine kinase
MTAKEQYTMGPRLLVVATCAVIALGAIFIYFRDDSQPSYLFFFYLPVAVASVVLGRMVGLLLAFLTVALTLLPSISLGFHHLMSAPGSTAESAAILIVWAVFLTSMAFLVGWISERGGSLSFAQGLGGQAIRAMELERKRTGQDIHDGLAQYAAAASLETQVLAETTAETDPQVQLQVERVKQSLDLLVLEARTMIGNLRPPALGPDDFNDSMSGLVESLQNRTGIFSDLELEGDFGIHTDSARICVYRIAQEALANAEHHSGATTVRVWARASKSGVDLIVRDDGKGFDPESLPPRERESLRAVRYAGKGRVSRWAAGLEQQFWHGHERGAAYPEVQRRSEWPVRLTFRALRSGLRSSTITNSCVRGSVTL